MADACKVCHAEGQELVHGACSGCEKSLRKVCRHIKATKGSHCDDYHKKRQEHFVSRELFDQNCKAQLLKFDEVK